MSEQHERVPADQQSTGAAPGRDQVPEEEGVENSGSHDLSPVKGIIYSILDLYEKFYVLC